MESTLKSVGHFECLFFCFKLATPGWHLSIYTGWACVRALGVLCKPPIQIPLRRVEARLRLGEATRHQHASPGRGRRRRREGQRGRRGGVRDHRRRTHVGGRPWRCSASCWTCATSPLPCSTASSRYLPRSRPPARFLFLPPIHPSEVSNPN